MTEHRLPDRCLVDTNVLLRITQPYQEFPDYHRAIERLYLAGTILYITFQNLAKYWNAATRPQQAKGLGLHPSAVRTALETLLIDFVVLYEDHQVFRRWLQLVSDHQVRGRQVHDARLVSHMLVRNIPATLTSNTKDFLRYHHIQALDPELIA